MNDLIFRITHEFQESVVLQYYLGVYYERDLQFDKAKEQHLKCIKLAPDFAPPFLNYGVLVDMTKDRDSYQMMESCLLSIFNRPTRNGNNGGAMMSISLSDNLKIIRLLVPYYLEAKRIDDAKYLCKTFLKSLPVNPTADIELIAYKDIYFRLSQIYAHFDMTESHEYAVKGIGIGGIPSKDIDALNDSLLYSVVVASDYMIGEHYPWEKVINDSYDKHREEVVDNYPSTRTDKSRIRIGYISSNFNRNAMSLFFWPILKHTDTSKFEVYCYYGEARSDVVTTYLKSLTEKWYDVSSYSSEMVANLIRQHSLDILIDLDAHAHNGNMQVIIQQPSNVIANYLGFPNHTYIKEFKYRLTDKYVDCTETYEKYKEKNAYFPRQFLCFAPFPMMKIPEIVERKRENVVRIGIFNKIVKHHPIIRDVWRRMLKKYSNVELWIKLNPQETSTPLYRDFPENQVKLIPFSDDIFDYYNLFNQVDFLVDTYPYSGTATTCSGLWMGLPTITIYSETNPHASNVSGALLKYLNESSGLDMSRYISQNLEEYEMLIEYHIRNPNDTSRMTVSQSFKTMMNPVRFTQEYEHLIQSLI